MKTPYPVQWAAGLASSIFPLFVKQEHNKIILTSFHGDGYRGNTRVLYEKLCRGNKLNPVWLSRNKNIVQNLKDQFGSNKAELAHSFAGMRALASASFILFTHGTSDYPFLRLPRRANLIQTYHGLPTKRGEYMRPNSNRRPGIFHRLLLQYRFNPIDFFISSSPFTTGIFSKRFNLPETRFLETGYPSYDHLINGNCEDDFIRKTWPDAPDYTSVILYSPTFRRLSKTRWYPFSDLDLDVIAGFLEKHNILLMMRPHPNEKVDIRKFTVHSNRIVDAGQHKVEDIYRILLCTDAIITDYSSIYIEGLLKNIPSIFIPYDLDSYERGLPFPYHDLTPGDKVSTQTEFLDALQRALHDPNYLQTERDRVKNIFFSSADGNATEKIIRFLEQQVNSASVNSG